MDELIATALKYGGGAALLFFVFLIVREFRRVVQGRDKQSPD